MIPRNKPLQQVAAAWMHQLYWWLSWRGNCLESWRIGQSHTVVFFLSLEDLDKFHLSSLSERFTRLCWGKSADTVINDIYGISKVVGSKVCVRNQRRYTLFCCSRCCCWSLRKVTITSKLSEDPCWHDLEAMRMPGGLARPMRRRSRVDCSWHIMEPAQK